VELLGEKPEKGASYNFLMLSLDVVLFVVKFHNYEVD